MSKFFVNPLNISQGRTHIRWMAQLLRISFYEDGRMTEKSEDKSWIEEVELAGEQLVEKIKELAQESQVRRVRILDPDGDIAVDIPLSVGAIAGGALVLAAPILAVVGAIAAFATKVKIEIVREEEAEEETPETEDA